MRSRMPDLVEKGRVSGALNAECVGLPYGHFFLRCPVTGSTLEIQASAGEADIWDFGGPPFDHVSVTVGPVGRKERRCPTWEEMCWVKGLFFLPDETVIQYHPPESVYVNYHPFCLHLWRPVGVEVPLPPTATIGPRAGGGNP